MTEMECPSTEIFVDVGQIHPRMSLEASAPTHQLTPVRILSKPEVARAAQLAKFRVQDPDIEDLDLRYAIRAFECSDDVFHAILIHS